MKACLPASEVFVLMVKPPSLPKVRLLPYCQSQVEPLLLEKRLEIHTSHTIQSGFVHLPHRPWPGSPAPLCAAGLRDSLENLPDTLCPLSRFVSVK